MKLVLGILLGFIVWQCNAQLYDKTWIVGNNCAQVKFETDTITTDTFDHYITTFRTWASICDEQGDLQFFTSGFYVFDRNGNIMNSGLDLCDPEVVNHFISGLPAISGALILPRGNNLYYVFCASYSDSQIQSGTIYAPDRLYYATVDMNMFGGLGGLTSRRNLLYGQPMCDEHLTACRHANGRDWWLVTNKYQSNEYIKYLVTPDSIYGPFSQTIGTAYMEPDALGQIVFSPDGTKLAGVSGNSQLVILDFDRCTGEFYNPILTNIQNDTIVWGGNTEVWGGGGQSVCFSPNNQYVYLGYQKVLYQYNLLESDLASSRKTIFKWDSSDSYAFIRELFLTPNGKVLLSCKNGAANKDFSVINKPNLLDTLCDLKMYGFHVSTANSNSINNTFNYRLGKLTGSACDTIINGVDEFAAEDVLQISPNPVKDKVEIQLAKYLPDADLQISDVQGRIVYQNKNYYLAEYITTQDWPSGIYFVRISNGKKEVKGKFVKE